MSAQQELWHETLEDALRSVVDALGGFKRVGSMLWPALPIDDAGRKLAHCLDRDKPNKLDPDELLTILAKGREANCHVAITHICRMAGYADPMPVDPENEIVRLQREYIGAARLIASIAERIQKVQQIRGAA